MKKVLILMLGLVAGTASFANSSTVLPSAVSPVTSATRLVMTANHKIRIYVQPLDTKGELSIQDAKGHTLYDSMVTLQKGLYQQIDFSDLGAGTYQLTLNTGGQTLTKTFVVQANPNASYIMQ